MISTFLVLLDILKAADERMAVMAVIKFSEGPTVLTSLRFSWDAVTTCSLKKYATIVVTMYVYMKNSVNVQMFHMI